MFNSHTLLSIKIITYPLPLHTTTITTGAAIRPHAALGDRVRPEAVRTQQEGEAAATAGW